MKNILFSIFLISIFVIVVGCNKEEAESSQITENSGTENSEIKCETIFKAQDRFECFIQMGMQETVDCDSYLVLLAIQEGDGVQGGEGCMLGKAIANNSCETLDDDLYNNNNPVLCAFFHGLFVSDRAYCEKLSDRPLGDSSVLKTTCEEGIRMREVITSKNSLLCEQLSSEQLSSEQHVKLGSMRDWCYYRLAFILQDSNLCEKIQEQFSSAYCMIEMSIDQHDLSVCSNPKIIKSNIDCYEFLAAGLGDASLCKKSTIKNRCVSGLAINKEDIHICSEFLETEYEQQNCYLDFTLVKPSKESCAFLREEQKNSCLKRAAIQTNDPFLCPPEHREDCETQIKVNAVIEEQLRAKPD